MIDEDRTLQLFGYVSIDLKPKSHKNVVAVCEGCGRYRVLKKSRYHDLCKRCGIRGTRHYLYGKHPSVETCKKLSEAHQENYPSDETRCRMSKAQTGLHIGEKNPMFGKYGEKHHNWQGGLTPRIQKLRNSTTYKNWRDSVFKRDDYTCQMCNTRGGDLEAHHIQPVKDHKNDLLIFDVNNGITLCVKCHNLTKGHEYEFIDRFIDEKETARKLEESGWLER